MSERYKRFDRDFPKRKNPDGPGNLCRYCGKPLSGRRTAWCSTECHYKACLECGIGVRKDIFARDKGICTKCGLDTEAVKRAVNIMIEALPNDLVRSKVLRLFGIPGGIEHKYTNDRLYPKGSYPKLKRSLWDAHHTKAVARGGGGCGIDGYKTLCIWCHSAASRRQARARARKKAKELSKETP